MGLRPSSRSTDFHLRLITNTLYQPIQHLNGPASLGDNVFKRVILLFPLRMHSQIQDHQFISESIGSKWPEPRMSSKYPSLSWPERSVWQTDDSSSHCPFCEMEFTLLNRRHHCRGCGQLCCKKCGDYGLANPKQDNKISRVCATCYNKALTDSLSIELAPGTSDEDYKNMDLAIRSSPHLQPLSALYDGLQHSHLHLDQPLAHPATITDFMTTDSPDSNERPRSKPV